MRVLAAVGILVAWAAGLTALPAQPGGKTYRLSGTVVDGTGNRPLAGVEVLLQTEKWQPVGDSVISDSEGRFSFPAVAPGEYILSATGSFGTVNYGEAADPGWVSSVRVGAKGEDKSIVFSIVPRGSLEGVVRNEFGEPMMGMNVGVVRQVWSGGRIRMRTVTQKPSDDRGRYRFGNLAPGSYLVCALPNAAAAAPLPGPVDFAARNGSRIYTRTCSSRALQLAPGQHAQIDLAPLAGSAATVRGRILNVPPQSGVSVYLRSDDEGLPVDSGGMVDQSQGNYTFTIPNIPAGRYQLRAEANSGQGTGLKRLSAEMQLDVGGSDIDGVDVTLDSGSTMELTFANRPEDGIETTNVIPSLEKADSANGSVDVPRNPDGSYRFQVLPGRYRLQVNTPPESCVQSVKLGDREVRGVPFDIAAGATLHAEVTLSKNCGSIEAHIVRDGQAVPRAKVVLLLNGTPQNPGDLHEDFADDEGAYIFPGLAPGHYLVWAWTMDAQGGMTGPASLAAVEKQATAVDVTAGKTVQVDVPLLQQEGRLP